MSGLRARAASLPSALVFSAFVFSACAQDVPGVEPPHDRLHFPIGIAAVGQPAETLVVCNANMDQRYNAGTLAALPIDGLFAALPAPGAAGIVYDEDIGSKVSSWVRIHSFCGDVVASPAGDRVFVPTRQRNRVTMALLSDQTLRCASDGVAPIQGIDCSDGFVVRTMYADPFAAAYVPAAAPGRGDKVAIGHLRAELVAPGRLASGVGLLDVERMMKRVEAEASGVRGDDLPQALDLSTIEGVSGLNSVAAFTSSIAGARILGAGRRVPTTNVPPPALHDFAIETSSVAPGITLELGSIAGVQELRGIAVASSAPRAYASVRFSSAGASMNSGIAVVDLSEGLRFVSIVAVGTEIGRPVLLERAGVRLLYVPDFVDDVIWVLDVTSDQPAVVGRIFGVDRRTDSNGRSILANTLATPTNMVFVEREGRQIMFVSNFANSTLAAIDVGDPDPRAHRVIARFGLAVDTRGDLEGEGKEQ